MGFVLVKRFSGGKLICREFHRKLPTNSDVSGALGVLVRSCACGKLRSFFFRGSALCFCQPTASKVLVGNTRQVRFDIEDGSSIEHIDSAHVKGWAFASEQLHNCQPDRIGAPRRSRRENAVRTRIAWRLPDQFISISAIKHPKNK